MSFSFPINAIADLSDRAIFSLTGPDSLRYLNGQVSQDVALATEEKAVYSIAANFKGKLDGDCFIRKHGDAILIDCSSDQRDSLLMRLDHYLIADDAELEDATEKYSLFHTLNPELATSYPKWMTDRYGQDGIDFLLPKGEVLEGNVTHNAEWEILRISNSIPLWGKELTNEILPPEAKIEARAISYTKGCYTGQEVISRMRSAGKTNKHLVSIKLEEQVDTPCEFFTSENLDKAAGAVTSICNIEGIWIGLGYRTRKAEALTEFQTLNGTKIHVV